MKRIERMALGFCAALMLGGCSGGAGGAGGTAGLGQDAAPSQYSQDIRSLSGELPPSPVPAMQPGLDTGQQGYTISYMYSSAWDVQQEKDGDIRYTYYLVQGDINNQQILSVAERKLKDGEDIHNPTTKQQLLLELQLGDAVTNTDTVQLFGEDALEVEFSSSPGNNDLTGLLYVFQWNGYAYGFAYMGAQVEEADRELLASVLDGVVLE